MPLFVEACVINPAGLNCTPPEDEKMGHKERTIRKLMGRGGRAKYKKKYSRKGKLNEKKIMHALKKIITATA